MKIYRLPLPEPWTLDAVVVHMYRAWSNQGQGRVQRIALVNPLMVHSLVELWRPPSDKQATEAPHGILEGIGTWQLVQNQDGSGIIEIHRDAP